MAFPETSFALSTKQIECYKICVNEHLKKLPYEKNEDFEINKTALKILLVTGEIPTSNEKLKERIEIIKTIIDQPQLYIEDPKYYEQFKKIVKESINTKIEEIENLSKEEKIRYLEEQTILKNKSQTFYWKADEKESYNPERENGSKLDLNKTVKRREKVAKQIYNKIIFLYNNEEYSLMDLIIKNVDQFIVLMFFLNEEDALETILGLDELYRSQILENANAVAQLIDMGFALETIIESIADLNEPVKSQIIDNAGGIVELIKLGVSFESISKNARIKSLIERGVPFKTIINNACHLGYLIMEAGVSFDTIISLEEIGLSQRLRNNIQSNVFGIHELISANVPLTTIISFDEPFRSQIIENAYEFALLNKANVSLNAIKDLDEPVRSEIIKYAFAVAAIIKAGESLISIVCLAKKFRNIIYEDSYFISECIKSGEELIAILQMLNKERNFQK